MKINMPEEETPAIAMEPMIDCVFLLLIFFLIVATIRKKHNELPLELAPAINAVEVKADDSTVVLSILKNGDIYFSTIGAQYSKGMGAQESITVQKLLDRLDKISQTNPNRNIRIDADVKAPVGRVVEVMDALGVRNLKNIGFRTQD